MHRRDRGRGKRFQHEIAIRHGVYGIGHRSIEAKPFGGHRAINRKGSSGERRGPEWALISPLPRVPEAAGSRAIIST